MDYITAQEAADKWGITRRRVQVLCSQNRIKGVKRLGNMWVIPKDAEKPVDGRSLRYMKDKMAIGGTKHE
ncbi:MAG: helix-turn-helix domain-containing protein [Firmicutes bacterium]|nr:helix-turn-helix domain-containing protein [Bacillota bacterium]